MPVEKCSVKRAILFIVCAAVLSMPVAAIAASPNAQSILVVFAHPDDDIIIGPLLAHYVKQGVPVQTVTVMSGDGGVSPHAGIPAGEQLARVRKEEIRQACEAYGIPESIMLGRRDGSLLRMNEKDCRELIAQIGNIIDEKRPAVVITFGPEGYTGHGDHRILGMLTTQIFQSWDPAEHGGYAPQKLYYATIPKSKWTQMPQILKDNFLYTNDEFVNTAVDAADGREEAMKALQSYKSQFAPDLMEIANNFFSGDILRGTVYLRRALSAQAPAPIEKDLFEGLQK